MAQKERKRDEIRSARQENHLVSKHAMAVLPISIPIHSIHQTHLEGSVAVSGRTKGISQPAIARLHPTLVSGSEELRPRSDELHSLRQSLSKALLPSTPPTEPIPG
ncbi:hypothetical protein BLNAU_12187 [Blattamonas nauphoetae]|uniref:Uncharacterized protein n=1 Tax=Blattamonas nauphoetae TaxID=2049346 RepID=A0ABQ9XKB1_9EUKA|nr:hypothetical protein BLNAU_12187 [Blattamonas nauphoetae]